MLLIWAEGSWQHIWIGGVLDRNTTAMAFDASGRLWAGCERTATRLTRTPMGAGQFAWQADRAGGVAADPGAVLPGLPVVNVSTVALHAATRSMWIAGDGGAAELADGAFRLYSGARYFASLDAATDRVTYAVPLPASNATLLVTRDGSMTVLEQQLWTLDTKAAQHQAAVLPRHDRHGIVSDVHLQTPGNPTPKKKIEKKKKKKERKKEGKKKKEKKEQKNINF